MNLKKSFILSILVFFISPHLSFASNEEDIFENAKQFTLKISTSITTPFIFDEKASQTGTGFLVDKERGWLITNAHVASRSPSVIKGSFHKQENVSLTKVYIDPSIDVAILKISPKDIPKNATESKLDCDSNIKPGYAVGAYGHPWGLNYTATRGIVSGTPFIIKAKWIQTDAPINSGNSGGPLLSMKTGRVVGINSATLAKDKTEGLNFALPIKYACKIITLLKNEIDPSPYMMPVLFYKQKDNKSLIVAKVMDDKSNGFKEGDTIVGIKGDSHVIDNPMELQHVLRDKNSDVVIRVKRNDKEIELPLSLTRHDKVIGRTAIYVNGMTIAPSHIYDRSLYQFENTWVVQDVETGTTAESEEVKVWGIITHINNSKLKKDTNVLKLIKSKDKVTLRIQYVNEGIWEFYEYEKVEFMAENIKQLKI